MSVLSGPSDDMMDHASASDMHDDANHTVSVELFYWSAMVVSASITVLGFWKLFDLML